MAQEVQLQVLGTKAQVPKGLSGSWQSMPKQQGMLAQLLGSLAAQHLQRRQSWNGANLLRPTLPMSLPGYWVSSTGRNLIMACSPGVELVTHDPIPARWHVSVGLVWIDLFLLVETKVET